MAAQSKDVTLSSDSLDSHHICGPEKGAMGLEQKEDEENVESWQSGEKQGTLAPK